MERLLSIIGELDKAREKLTKARALSKKEFLNNPVIVDSTKYNFIVAIEAVIDICNVLIAEYRWGVPERYADVCRLAGKEAQLPEEFIERLEDMVRFRNLLVHMYGRVDDRKVWDILQKNLDDFELFKTYLRKSGLLG